MTQDSKGSEDSEQTYTRADGSGRGTASDGGEVGTEEEEGKGATSGRGATRQRVEGEEGRGVRGHRRQGKLRPRGIKAGRGAERQQAKKKRRSGKRQKEVADGARARLEQQESGHMVHMEPEGGEDQVGRWVRDCPTEGGGRGSRGAKGQGSSAGSNGCLCRDPIDGSSVSSEDGGGVHPARRKGGGVLSSISYGRQ